MAEVRTTSSTGGQKGTKLARYDLIPQGPLEEVAEHFGVGARKYDNHQWRQGYEWSKSFAAKQRHDAAFWAGYDYDVCSNDPDGCRHVDEDGVEFVPVRPDTCFNHTGSHHMAASAWHALVLLEFKDRFPAFDDRYDPAEDDEKYREATKPGPEWQELGYIEELQDPALTTLSAHQAAVQRALDWMTIPGFGSGRERLDLTSRPVEVDWKDPALPTAPAMQDAINKIVRNEWLAEHYVVFPRVDTVRFTGHVHGADTEDHRLIELASIGLLRKHPYAVPFEVPHPFVDQWDELNDAAIDTVGDDH